MISFIVPTHNYGFYLKKCINSILSNDNKLIKEIIIVNDASTDNTKVIYIKNFKKIKKIKYFEKNFYSLSKSTNFGIKKSTGKWISKIDADDWVSNNFAKTYINFLKKKKLDFIYSNLILFHQRFKTYKIKNQQVSGLKRLFKYPVGSGTLFKKKIWKKIKGFNEKIYYQDDYDFWLKINNLKYIKIGYINKQLYYYRFHKSNMSKNFLKKNITKILILIRNIFKI